MRLFTLAFLSLFLLTSPTMVDARGPEIDPDGLVADCDGVAEAAVQRAREMGRSLEEVWNRVDPQGACFGVFPDPSGFRSNDLNGWPYPDPLGFGPDVDPVGYGLVYGTHGVRDGYPSSPPVDPDGAAPPIHPDGFDGLGNGW